MERHIIQSLLRILLVMILTVNISYAKDFSLRVDPKHIDIGEAVLIEFDSVKDGFYLIRILSPSGNKYEFVPEKSGDDRYQLLFQGTSDRGFLTEDWNRYEVMLLNSDDKLLDSTDFYLNQKQKLLYFTVYVDDIGLQGYLDIEGQSWFKSIGGKLNLGFQHDDRIGYPLSLILKKYSNGNDYIFHHFHSWRFSGSMLLLKVHQLLKWNSIKTQLNSTFGLRLRNRHYFLIFTIILLFSILLNLFRRNRLKILILGLSVFLYILFCSAVYSHIHFVEADNWEIKLSDVDWNKKFLKRISDEFRINQLSYPSIVRHGWNIPPRDMNEFYISSMGVLADASFIFPDFEKIGGASFEGYEGKILSRVSEYSYEWPRSIELPLPYYTNFSDNFDVPWDGDEINRGVLEIPVTFDDIASYGFVEKDKQTIDRLPSGALISTYLHPREDLLSLENVISYVDDKYTLDFTTALEYLYVYLDYNPRPILIDMSLKKAFWAQLTGEGMISIAPTDRAKVAKNQKITISTVKLPPYIGIRGQKYDLRGLSEMYNLVGTLSENTKLFKLKYSQSECSPIPKNIRRYDYEKRIR